jgi:hypothetical protein
MSLREKMFSYFTFRCQAECDLSSKWVTFFKNSYRLHYRHVKFMFPPTHHSRIHLVCYSYSCECVCMLHWRKVSFCTQEILLRSRNSIWHAR